MSSYAWYMESMLTLPNTALLTNTWLKMLQVFVNQLWITVSFQRRVCAVQNSSIIGLIFRKKYLQSITLSISRQGRKNMEVAMHAAFVSKRLITGAATTLTRSREGRGRAACQAWAHGTGRTSIVFKSKSGERCPLYISPAVACLDDH